MGVKMSTRQRTVEVQRKTKETDIRIRLNLDGSGASSIDTGIGFLDHMLELFAKHGLFGLEITARGDLKVDIHHTNEDVGITLGETFKKAIGKKAGIKRFGVRFIPMDEALAKIRVVLDMSGRSSLYFNSSLKMDVSTGQYALKDAREFLKGFVNSAGINMHVDILNGDEPHHILEATFKAFGKAMDEATQVDPRVRGVPSTKGRL